MPDSTDPIQDIGQFLLAYCLVAAVAIPLAFFTWKYAGRNEVFPAWRSERIRWNGFVVFLLFLSGMVILPAFNFVFVGPLMKIIYGPNLETMPPSNKPDGSSELFIRTMWAETLTLGELLFTMSIVYWFEELITVPTPRQVAGRISLGALAWIISSPIVFVIYFAALICMAWMGLKPDEHPALDVQPGERWSDRISIFMFLCVVAPMVEEFLWRFLLIRWSMRRNYRPVIVVVAACIIALVVRRATWAPVVFIVGTGIMMLVVQKVGRGRTRFPRRAWSSVIASSAFFAAIHSNVWPSPIPLFFLAIVLGWMAVRTGGITACVVLHGLFNAVAYIQMLNGYTG